MSKITKTAPQQTIINSKEDIKTEDRVYHGEIQVNSDLFKLDVAKMLKDMSWNEQPEYVEVDHCHFFHTYDSSGKKLDKCNSIGGHFHMIEIEDNKDGLPKIKSVSGPMHFVKRKIRGRFKKVTEPIRDDEHTHDVSYIRSQIIHLRKPNTNAISVLAHDAQKTAPISGVIG